MNRRTQIEALSTELAKKMTDEGRLIEVGWLGLLDIAYPSGVTDEQGKQLRQAFFAGAQHLMGCIMNIMDDDSEPTANDLKKMDLIDQELQGWIEEFKHDNKITDPDLGPKPSTSH